MQTNSSRAIQSPAPIPFFRWSFPGRSCSPGTPYSSPVNDVCSELLMLRPCSGLSRRGSGGRLRGFRGAIRAGSTYYGVPRGQQAAEHQVPAPGATARACEAGVVPGLSAAACRPTIRDSGALGVWAPERPRARSVYSSVPQTSASTIVSFWPTGRAAKLARRYRHGVV